MIGIIDSGVGGIAVTAKVLSVYPDADVICIADGAFAPYGEKSPLAVSARVHYLVDELVSMGASAVLLACNTASVATAKDRFPLPIIRVYPNPREMLDRVSGRCLFLGTTLTCGSIKADERMTVKPLPYMAKMLDTFAPDFDIFDELTADVLRGYPDIGGIYLGCTHYLFLNRFIRKRRPSTKVFCGLTYALNELENYSSGAGERRLVATGNRTDAMYATFSSLQEISTYF